MIYFKGVHTDFLCAEPKENMKDITPIYTTYAPNHATRKI